MDIPFDVPHLRSVLAEAQGSRADSTVDYSIAMSLGAGYLARSSSGAPAFLVPLSVAPGMVGRRGGGFALSPASCIAFRYEDRRWQQPAAALECTDIGLLDTFFVLVLDLAKALATSRTKSNWPSILKWMDEWQTLLGRQPTLTIEQQLGLWGELWVVSKATDPNLLIAAWRGPDRDAVDFFLDGVALEVKTSRLAHVHHISQKQVELPVGKHDAYLLSLWVAPEPVRGISLAELVDSVMARVSDPAALLKQIALLGYSAQDHAQYGTRYLILDAPHWFRAADVPRVRSVDPGICQIRYVVTLDSENSLNVRDCGDLWRHFCQVESPISTGQAVIP